MNFIVVLIVVSSLFHRPNTDSHSDLLTGDGDDYDSLSDLSPFSSRPPKQNSLKKPLRPKDIAVAATRKSTNSIGKVTTPKSSLKNNQDSMVIITNGVKGVHESHQPEIFPDFSRLAKGKEVKKEQAAMDAGKTRTTEQGTRNSPESGEPNKGIQMPHSLDFSKEVKTTHNRMEETTDRAAKQGQVSRNEKQNQSKKQVNKEDWEEDESDDTLEATWMAINGGRKPQEKQLKKSETWPQPQKLVLPEEESEEEKIRFSALKKEPRKSMTFNETVTIRCKGGLRRDPSINLEELNQRFEAFIEKFNHEMRLQRQESVQRHLDMIRQGI